MKAHFFFSLLFITNFNLPTARGTPTKSPTPICTTLARAAQTQQAPAAKRLKQFLAEHWKYQMTEYPEWATYVGYPGQNDRWTDRSMAAIERRLNDTKCAMAALKKIRRADLRGEDPITYDLKVHRFETEIERDKFGEKFLAVDHLEGIHTEVADILVAMPALSKKDYSDMLKRLETFPKVTEQVQALLREGLKQKITPVKMFLQKVPSQIDRLKPNKIEDGPIYKPFQEMHSSLTAEEKSELQKRAKIAIETNVYPALERLKVFVVNDYIPNARQYISMAEMPNGKEWYAFLVKDQTTTSYTPDQLHQLGLSEVARITKEMEQIKEKVKFKGDLQAFNEFLLKDKKFYYQDKEQLLAGFRDIAKRIDPELPKQFKTLPRLTYGIREMPEFKAKESPAAYYNSGSIEGGRPGYFTANTFDLKARPKWGMEALTLHEAVPGHHFQIALGQEIQDLPEFRRRGGYTAFSEGWGLYAESLGEDLGFYKDPYSKYGQLNYEIWRAIRLVLDTGIHSKGWSRQQAIDYFQANMAKSKMEAEVEVDRYITWPGQALAYKVGQLKLLELKNLAKNQLGEKFDVREFHDTVLLHGSIPMSVLEKSVKDWIAYTRSKSLR